MKLLKLLLVASFGVLLIGFIAKMSLTYVPYDHKDSLVKLSGNQGHGSGMIIDSNKTHSLILTNKHVCEGISMDPEVMGKLQDLQKQMFIALMEGDVLELLELQQEIAQILLNQRPYPFDVKFLNLDQKPLKTKDFVVSQYNDLCLVKIPVGNLPKVRISKFRAEKFERVQTHSNPSIMENAITEGFVGEDVKLQGELFQHHSAIIFGGSSGSGTYNMDGELVGINTRSGSGAGLVTASYMLPLDSVILFIMDKMLPQPEKVDTPYIGGKL